jgi:hypothetical protein
VNLGDSGHLFPGLPSVREAGVRLLRGVLGLALLATAQVVMAGAAAHASPVEDFTLVDPDDPCGRTSWLAGSTELCSGVLVYRDYVVDDYGASDPLDSTNETELLGSLSRTEGDQRYADGSKAGTADLVDLSVRLEGNQLIAVFEVNALYQRGSTIGALAVDTDDDRGTGGGTWPGLGIESEGWDVIKKVTTGNTDSNLLRLTMPKPSGTRWRLQAVTAKADGTVMNVAFRGTNEAAGLAGSSWFEGKQAAALADGDITQFGTTVDVADLRNGVTRRARHTAPGFHERVFTSAYTIGTGEGYTYEPEYGRHGDSGQVCEQEFATVGRYQPYAVYVPQGNQRMGLQLFLHGCNANHTSQMDGEGFQTQFGDNLDRVIVAPLGRGPVGYYSDISEADVFEAVADAQSTYRLDRRRWFISGYSMGGYGTLRLGSLYPDLWAGATNWVGFTGDAANNPTGEKPGDYPSGAIGNAIDFVGNLEWVPSEHLYAGADYLVHSHTHTALALRLDEVGVDHEYYLHPTAEHLTFVLLDEWTKEAAKSKGRTLVTDPPRPRLLGLADSRGCRGLQRRRPDVVRVRQGAPCPEGGQRCRRTAGSMDVAVVAHHRSGPAAQAQQADRHAVQRGIADHRHGRGVPGLGRAGVRRDVRRTREDHLRRRWRPGGRRQGAPHRDRRREQRRRCRRDRRAAAACHGRRCRGGPVGAPRGRRDAPPAAPADLDLDALALDGRGSRRGLGCLRVATSRPHDQRDQGGRCDPDRQPRRAAGRGRDRDHLTLEGVGLLAVREWQRPLACDGAGVKTGFRCVAQRRPVIHERRRTPLWQRDPLRVDAVPHQVEQLGSRSGIDGRSFHRGGLRRPLVDLGGAGGDAQQRLERLLARDLPRRLGGVGHCDGGPVGAHLDADAVQRHRCAVSILDADDPGREAFRQGLVALVPLRWSGQQHQ